MKAKVKTSKGKKPNVQYDSIAEKYTQGEDKRLARNYAFTPTFFQVLGNVRGKKVLDVAG